MCTYTYANHMYTYSYVAVVEDRTYHNTNKVRNIMIIFIRALYNQNAYLYMYSYIHHLKVFTSSLYTLTAISIHHSLIDTFLPTTPRNDSEIKISVNSKQDVPISNVSP